MNHVYLKYRSHDYTQEPISWRVLFLSIRINENGIYVEKNWTSFRMTTRDEIESYAYFEKINWQQYNRLLEIESDQEIVSVIKYI